MTDKSNRCVKVPCILQKHMLELIMFTKGHGYYPPKNRKDWLEKMRKGAALRRGTSLTEETKNKLRLAKENKPLKGGIKINSQGYRYLFLPNHPFKQSGKYYAEHRFVVENYLRENDPENEALLEVNGVKYLRPDYIVHHINRKKLDNRPENLRAMPRNKHHGHIITCPFCNQEFNY